MVAVFCLATYLVYEIALDMRTEVRWLIQRSDYKARVLAQPEGNGAFKHVEWDGWGFAGSDTTVYLVFDPSDSLRKASGSRSPQKYNGIPCEVPNVQRMEKGWYTVLFYTDTAWDHCS
jgi:hypothetical protein